MWCGESSGTAHTLPPRYDGLVKRTGEVLKGRNPGSRRTGGTETPGPRALLKNLTTGIWQASQTSLSSAQHSNNNQVPGKEGSPSKSLALAFVVGRMAFESKEGTGVRDARRTS